MDDYQKSKEEINRSFLVSASAGTGKTRVLVDRYVNILKQTQTTVDQIVAITFTEKAAGEMRERIRRTLRSATQTSALNINETLDKLSTAPISTIHSFCAQVLQENSAEMELDPQFRIVDEIEESILRKESLELFLHLELAKADSPILILIKHFDLHQIRETLNSVWQRQADFIQPLLSVAKKTPVELYEQIKRHYHDNTFSLFKEFFGTIEARQAIIVLQTYHAKNSEDSLQQVKTAALAVIDEIMEGKIPIAVQDGSIAAAFSLNKKGKKDNWNGKLEDVRNAMRTLRAGWDEIKDRVFPFNPDLEQMNANLSIAFAKLASVWLDYYRHILNDQAVVDFNGLEILTESFFRSKTSTARNYANRFKHLLVDEFQDVSPIQDRIFRAILDLNSQLITFYVGDEKQSIYRFRGAEVEIFNTHKNSKLPLYLDKNFRSLKSLNDFFNQFFRFLFNQRENVPIFDVQYKKPVESDDRTVSREFPVDLLVLNPDDDKRDSELSLIDAEFVHVVQRLKQLHGRSIVKTGTGELRPTEWRDFTILLRSRTHQEKLERVLNQAGIRYYVCSGIGFYQRHEVLDVINFLRVLLNWYDEVALVGTLRSPMAGLSDTALMSFSTKNGLMEGIQKILENDDNYLKNIKTEYIEQFQTFYRKYLEIRQQVPVLSTAELIRLILDKTHYLAILAAFPEEKQSYANVLKLIDLALEWSIAQEISPVDFIRRIHLYQALQVREGEANLSSEIEDSVTIMTIHAAKGLAFPIVVIPELAAANRGSTNRILADSPDRFALNLKTTFNDRKGYYYQYLAQLEKVRSLAEEKRILYVAATRAESYLILSTINKSGKQAQTTWHNIASFFERENCPVHRHEVSFGEIGSIYSNFQPDSAKIVKKLSTEQKLKIQRQLEPLSLRQEIKKVTPTAFAAWISHQAGEMPGYEKYTLKNVNLNSSGKLAPLELGTVIHQAFSWWDFQNIDSLLNYVDQLVKPFSMDAPAYRELRIQVTEWGKKFTQSQNALHKYIQSAVEINREIDAYARLSETLIEGKIDLLLKTDGNEYIIVDFKTDHIQGYPDTVLMNKYNAQLDLYALMLKRWSRLNILKTCLYFVRNGLLIEQDVDDETILKTETLLNEFIQRQGN